MFKFKKLLDDSKPYANPPIPEGYKLITKSWKRGLTIKDMQTGNLSVWIPACSFIDMIDLSVSDSNLAIRFPDGSFKVFKDTSKEAFLQYQKNQKYQSTLKYGGFYIGKFPITVTYDSQDPLLEIYTSKPNSKLLTDITYYEFLSICQEMGSNKITSEMMYESERDLLLIWLILSETLTEHQVYEDSSNLGYYFDDIHIGPALSGGHCIFHISDLCGNLWELVQSKHNINGKTQLVKVGGSWGESGRIAPLSRKYYFNSEAFNTRPSRYVCARHSLNIK